MTVRRHTAEDTARTSRIPTVGEAHQGEDVAWGRGPWGQAQPCPHTRGHLSRRDPCWTLWSDVY